MPFDEAKKQAEYKLAYDLLNQPVPNPMIEDMLRILNISKRKEILNKYQGLQLFIQFIQLGAQLSEAAGDEQVQAVLVGLAEVPGGKELVDLLLQAGQLAGQVKV